MKDIPKRPFSQCLSTIISPLFAEVRCPADLGQGVGVRRERKQGECCQWNLGGEDQQEVQANALTTGHG